MTKLRNIGPKSTERLAAVDVYSLEDVERLGVVETYLRVKAAFPDRVSLNLLWGLQGALMGIPWNQIPDDIKQDLLKQINESN
jgi:DNA transformation protein